MYNSRNTNLYQRPFDIIIEKIFKRFETSKSTKRFEPLKTKTTKFGPYNVSKFFIYF